MSLRMFRAALLGSLTLSVVVFWYGKKAGRVGSSRWGPAGVWVVPLLFVLLDIGYRQNWIPRSTFSTARGYLQRPYAGR